MSARRQKSFKINDCRCLFKVFKSIPHNNVLWDTFQNETPQKYPTKRLEMGYYPKLKPFLGYSISNVNLKGFSFSLQFHNTFALLCYVLRSIPPNSLSWDTFFDCKSCSQCLLLLQIYRVFGVLESIPQSCLFWDTPF